MGGYKPVNIKAYETGLIQNREEFLLPNDAYPVLENAFVWRERIKRKQGAELLGRLRRLFEDVNFLNLPATGVTQQLLTVSGYIANTNTANPGQVTTKAPHRLTTGDIVIISDVAGATGYNDTQFTITVVDDYNYTIGVDASGFGAYVSGGIFISNRPLSAFEPQAQIEPGSVVYTISTGPIILIDQGDGTLATVPPSANTGTINYETGALVINHGAAPGTAVIVSYNYFPGIPVMGLRSRELNNINFEQTVAFDQIYAYRYVGGWQEFIPGTTWSGTDSDFFWSTNYWVGNNNLKIFWVTNFSGQGGDPIRYTNGTQWVDFAPQINATPDRLYQCLAMLPFRGRMVTFNTLEGATLATSVAFTNRIRWAAIGTPFSDTSPIVSTVSANAWRDDIRGKGGFLDIPTSESIVSVGFVRDNLVIYCERSTWQLRYTGRSIAPFQIEKVNTELGAESTFSAVQFDTTLVGIGDKGVVSCDSFKSERIDIKIPDLIFQFNNDADGTKRVHGIRDFVQRLAYWTFPYKPTGAVFPDRRLVFNYENGAWAIFTDSYTTLGNYQPINSRRWSDFPPPDPLNSWQNQNISWIDRPSGIPALVGGNQQGYVMFLDTQVTNDVSLMINNITGNTTTPTSINSVNHNLQTGQVIQIQNIAGGSFTNLNNQIFGIVRTGNNDFQLWKYNATTQQFSDPQLDSSGTYIGGGEISVRDNFRIVSKKFNFMDQGQNIQMGYIDILMEKTSQGAITLLVYKDYNENTPSNTFPQNNIPIQNVPDVVFNTQVPTYPSPLMVPGGSKNWRRVYCASRGNFLTIEWTLSKAQLIGPEQESDVQIDSQVVWIRPGGRMSI